MSMEVGQKQIWCGCRDLNPSRQLGKLQSYRTRLQPQQLPATHDSLMHRDSSFHIETLLSNLRGRFRILSPSTGNPNKCLNKKGTNSSNLNSRSEIFCPVSNSIQVSCIVDSVCLLKPCRFQLQLSHWLSLSCPPRPFIKVIDTAKQSQSHRLNVVLRGFLLKILLFAHVDFFRFSLV